MAYKCLDCGHIFEEGEQAFWSESRGEYWGEPCSEEVSGCPLCRGDYEKTIPCEICGAEHTRDELFGGVCEECIEKYQNDLDMCLKIGANDTEDVKLNYFLASMFDKEEIEKILFKELVKAKEYLSEYIQKDCEKFANSNRDWFVERLIEEVKKNENAKG